MDMYLVFSLGSTKVTEMHLYSGKTASLSVCRLFAANSTHQQTSQRNLYKYLTILAYNTFLLIAFVPPSFFFFCR